MTDRTPNRLERLTLAEILLGVQLLAMLGGLVAIGYRAGQIENRLSTAVESLSTTSAKIDANDARIDANGSRIQANELRIDEHGRRIHSLEEKVR